MSRPLLAIALLATGLAADLRGQSSDRFESTTILRSAAIDAAPWRAIAFDWIPSLASSASKAAVLEVSHDALDPAEGRSASEAIPGAGVIPAGEPAPQGDLVRTAWVPSAPVSDRRSELRLGLASPEPLSLVLAGIAILGLVFLARRRPA